MKDYDKNKESPCLKYWNMNKLYRWEMPQKKPGGCFEWVKEISQFNEDSIVIKDIFFP